MKKFQAGESDVKKRLDVFVVEHMPALSRAFVHKLCDEGKVLVNAKQEKNGYKLREGDKVTVDYDLSQLGQIPNIEIPIIYEDDDCVVINKPLGLLTHSKGVFNPEPTVATWLQQRLDLRSQISENTTPSSKLQDLSSRQGIVHRLDRATSGVMICAKTPEALSWLQRQFSTRKVHKAYMAIVEGILEPEEAIIDMPIERNPKKPQTFRVGANGKAAVTAYQTISSNRSYSLVKLQPTTGRTHQLRVHLKHQEHPIVGDVFYGGKPAQRLYLHALSLELTLPSKERRTFEAPLPVEFNAFMETDT